MLNEGTLISSQYENTSNWPLQRSLLFFDIQFECAQTKQIR
jgi:hypothetical protein